MYGGCIDCVNTDFPSPFLFSLPHHPLLLPPSSAPIWSQVTAEEVVQFVAAGQPNVFECLCDTVSSQEHELKRVKKSVDRTLKFLDQTLSALEGREVSTRGPQLVVCAYEISKSDEYNESRDTEYTRIYCFLYGDC